MASATQIKYLDELIELFQTKFSYYFEGHSIWREWDPIDGSWDELREDGFDPFFHIEEMRDGEQAAGNCGLFANIFAHWMDNRDGIDVEIFDGTPEDFSYTDRTTAGHDGHAATLIHYGGHRFLIDFTASQYGYTQDFPFVQRMLDDGSLVREWDLATELPRPPFAPDDPAVQTLISQIQSVLTPDLLDPKYRDREYASPLGGHCAKASEAFYYMTGGKAAGLTPAYVEHENSTHWWLRTADGRVIDITAEQFETPVPYDKGTGCGFQHPKKIPTKAAQQIIDRVQALRAGVPQLVSDMPSPAEAALSADANSISLR